jgi:hypothetical protein
MTRQSNALLYRVNSGIPGDVSRRQFTVVEPVQLNPSTPFSAYGQVGKFVSGCFVPLVANDTAAVVAGFLVRPYPIQTANADGSGISTFVFGDQMRRGFMTVVNNAGTPATEGQVYIRVANPASGTPIGGIEAAAVGTTVGAATVGNTGNGTIGSVSSTAAAQLGAYTVVMTAATKFTMSAPDGTEYVAGSTGAVYSAGGITATITVGGTPMVAGDSFTITVARSTVPLPGAVFKSAADASGNVEIQYNI